MSKTKQAAKRLQEANKDGVNPCDFVHEFRLMGKHNTKDLAADLNTVLTAVLSGEYVHREELEGLVDKWTGEGRVLIHGDRIFQSQGNALINCAEQLEEVINQWRAAQ